MRGKRGQIYILAVIIIGFLLYVIVAPRNFLHQEVREDDFEELSENYQRESARLLNEELNVQGVSPQTLEDIFLNFTVTFTSFSKTKNPNFGIIYAFPYKGQVLIGNYAEVPINIISGPTIQGCFTQVTTSISLYGLNLETVPIDRSTYASCIEVIPYPTNNKLDINIEGTPYSFSLDPARSDIMVLSRQSTNEDVKVFISE